MWQTILTSMEKPTKKLCKLQEVPAPSPSPGPKAKLTMDPKGTSRKKTTINPTLKQTINLNKYLIKKAITSTTMNPSKY